MNDDRISTYLNDQAQGIALSPADPAGAARRGNRRRTRRRAGLLGSVAVVGMLATSVAVRDSGRDEVVSQLGASATASTFDWSTVTPRVGLGYGDHTAQLADGTVYSISTAPGPHQDDGTQSRSTLYSSTDGAEWSAATLPSGVRTSDLAGAGDTLYSLGTSPAGGLVLSSSDDGAASWTSTPLPSDVQGLVDRHPGLITLGGARLAAHDSTHVVAAIVASTNLDLAKLGHPEHATDGTFVEWDANGATVRENPKGECDAGARRTIAAGASGALEDGKVTDPNANPDAPVSMTCNAPRAGEGEIVATYTYDQLGITGELRDHVGGMPYVFSTDDGTDFTRVALPADLVQGIADGFVATPVATDDGYRLVISGSGDAGPSATVLRSTDGATWTADTTLSGSPNDVGVVGGRAAISMFGKDGSSDLRIQAGDGSWTRVDLANAVTAPAGGSTYVESVAFGPLGFAAIVGTSTEDGPYVQHLVHSTDGSTLQVIAIADHIDGGGMVSGLVVTADAIVVRVTDPADDDPGTPAAQHVLVGTPA